MPNSVEACKTQFINQLKEADFVRWRNTNKVTSLRRVDIEAGWDGIVQGESSANRFPYTQTESIQDMVTDLLE